MSDIGAEAEQLRNSDSPPEDHGTEDKSPQNHETTISSSPSPDTASLGETPDDISSQSGVLPYVTGKNCARADFDAPPQCVTPISIMYDFLAHHNLPCKYKPSFEQSARECLLALGEGDHRESRLERGKVTSHARETRRKKKQEKRVVTRGDGGDLRHPDPSMSNDDGAATPTPQYLMTSDDVFARLAALLSPKLAAEGFGQWATCPNRHELSVQDNIPDAGFYPPLPGRGGASRRASAVLYNHGADEAPLHRYRREANSASGRLGVKTGSSTVLRGTGGGGKEVGQRSRQTSPEVAAAAEQLWREMELDGAAGIQPMYSFKHFKRTQEYADQYRETYTLNHLREKSIHAVAAAKSSRKSNLPKAGYVCSVNRNKKGALEVSRKSGNNKGHRNSARIARDHREEHSGIKWHMNPRLRDTCDPHLSVNNPTPLEITALGKMPVIRRSSPSIPSNTNGKYGGRGSSNLYPFQLQISTESRTISTPYKRFPGSLLGQR